MRLPPINNLIANAKGNFSGWGRGVRSNWGSRTQDRTMASMAARNRLAMGKTTDGIRVPVNPAAAQRMEEIGWRNARRGYYDPVAGAARSYVTGPGAAGRIAVGAGGLVAAGTAYRAVTGGGGPTRDRRGNFDIAGIPFM